MFGVLALIDRRWKTRLRPPTFASASAGKPGYGGRRWIFIPMILSLVYFFLSLKVINYFNPAGQYKFLYYYSWLGSSIPDIIRGLFTHPWEVVKHFLTVGNLDMVVGFLMPFFFLPLLRPKYLLLSLGIFLQILLGAPGGSELILQTHYSSLFIPALFISFIYGFDKIQNSILFSRHKILMPLILIISTVYSCFVIGPLPAVAKKIIKNKVDWQAISLEKEFVSQVPADSSVVTTYRLLPALSSRDKVYSLKYVFLEKTQFAAQDYTLPEETEYLLIDFDDLITYQVHFPKTSWIKDYYSQGDDNLRRILEERNFGIVSVLDTLVLFKKNYKNDIKLYELKSENQVKELNATNEEIILDDKVELLGWESNSEPASAPRPLRLAKHGGQAFIRFRAPQTFSFYWQALQTLEEDYQLRVTITNQDNKLVQQKIYPLAYGLYPTSEWKPGEIIKTNYWFLIPKGFNENIKFNIELVKIDGHLEMNGIRSGERKITKTEVFGERVELIRAQQ